jgi:hypothetical protein
MHLQICLGDQNVKAVSNKGSESITSAGIYLRK